MKKNKIIKKFSCPLSLFFLFLSINPALAQGRSTRPPYGPRIGVSELSISNPALSEALLDILGRRDPGLTFFNLLLQNLIILIFIIAALAFFFMFIIGGIQWITSGGDKAATESARGRITAALIGLVIVFSVYAILKLIDVLLGIDLTEIDISGLFLE